MSESLDEPSRETRGNTDYKHRIGAVVTGIARFVGDRADYGLAIFNEGAGFDLTTRQIELLQNGPIKLRQAVSRKDAS